MKCKHYKGKGYEYKIKDEEVFLCDQCNLLLAGEVMKQLALTVFIEDFKIKEQEK